MIRKVFAVLFFVVVFCSPVSGYSQDEIDALDDLMQKLFIASVYEISEWELQKEITTEKDEGDEEESPPTMLAELLE